MTSAGNLWIARGTNVFQKVVFPEKYLFKRLFLLTHRNFFVNEASIFQKM